MQSVAGLDPRGDARCRTLLPPATWPLTRCAGLCVVGRRGQTGLVALRTKLLTNQHFEKHKKSSYSTENDKELNLFGVVCGIFETIPALSVDIS